ncbi:hypothetical protein HYT58_00220 [Candidatus Woesearchaeota archaeon]|nr:hypothetical protein [Candidatus Woesearchaeota archaeon]
METLITCKRCRDRVPVSELKSDSKATGWVCHTCYAKEHNLISPAPTAKPAFKVPINQSYVCDFCKHKFNSAFKQKLCPNCGERDALRPAGGSGAGLIWEVEDLI